MRKSIRNAVAWMGIIALSGIAAQAQTTGVQPLAGGEQIVSEPAPAEAPAKLPAELKEKALRGESVSVLMVLSDGIPAGEVEAIRSRFAPQLDSLDRRLGAMKSAGRGAAQTASRQALAKERDAVLVSQRKSLVEAGRQAFQLQQTTVANRLESIGGKVHKRFSITNMIEAELSPAAILALESMPEVVTVSENKTRELRLINSTRVLGAPVFWDYGFGGGTQTVAVIDSGIAPNQAGFKGLNVSALYQLEGAVRSGCATGRDIDPWDRVGHGTHVAGIIASQGIPGLSRLTGVAPGVRELISVKVGAEGKGVGRCGDVIITDEDVFTAMEFVAAETPARVVNLSLGRNTSTDDALINWIVDSLSDTFDMVFVFAAGNEGDSRLAYQVDDGAVSFNSIAVANQDMKGTLTRTDDEVHFSSSRGPTRLGRKKPDLAAPGTKIVSLAPGSADAVATMTGTSMAAPHIAGAAALLLDAGLSGLKQVKALLINSSDGVGWRRDWGFGAANLNSAFDQMSMAVTAKVNPGRARFYAFDVNGPARATLVWNRHIEAISPDGKTAFGDFRNLDLGAYADSRTVATSSSRLDNVEQINLTGTGTAILKVSHNTTDAGPEEFALAFTNPNFQEVSGPQVRVNCASTPEVPATMKVAIACQATNTGDLPMFGVALRMLAPAGFIANTPAVLERIRPGETVTVRFEMSTTTNARGNIDYFVTLEGTAYGDTYSGRVPLSVFVRAPKPQDCTPVITPASGTLHLSTLYQTFTVKVQFPRYDAGEPGTCSYSVTEATSWFAISGQRTGGSAGGEFLVTVYLAPRSLSLAFREGSFPISVTSPQGTTRYNYTFRQNYQK